MTMWRGLVATMLVVAMSGCSVMSFRTTGTVELLREGEEEPEIAHFVSQERLSAPPEAGILCPFTFWLLGGGCWLYALHPNDDELKMIEAEAVGRLTREASCARVVSAKTTFLGWYYVDTGMQVKRENKRMYRPGNLEQMCLRSVRFSRADEDASPLSASSP